MNWVVLDKEGKRQRIAVARTPDGAWVGWAGGSALIGRERKLVRDSRHSNGAIRAPMTGTVVQVSVAPGDKVTENALLVIMEAMKMEYRLTSPRNAEVLAVHCKQGDLVDLGATLVALSA